MRLARQLLWRETYQSGPIDQPNQISTEDFAKPGGHDESGSCLGREPAGLSLRLLRPFAKLSFDREQEDRYFADHPSARACPLLVDERAAGAITDDGADRAGFFVCLSRCRRGRQSDVEWASLWE
jgi:hypothetical protein